MLVESESCLTLRVSWQSSGGNQESEDAKLVVNPAPVLWRPDSDALGMQGSKILGCVLGNNSYVGNGCTLEKTLVLGNDYYTNDKTRAASLEKGESALGIGELLPLIDCCILTD